MNKKNNKKEKLKRKASQDDLIVHKGPPLSKYRKSKFDSVKNRSKMSSQAASSSHSTKSNKEDNEETSKSQCDMCKLSYSCKDKLTEHLVSLMHHTKLEEAKENPKHDCVLCDTSFCDMSSYRDHIGTKRHLRNLDLLRNPNNNNKGRQEQNAKWSHNGHNRRENGPYNQEFRYQRPGPFNQFNNYNVQWQEPNFPRGPNYNNLHGHNFLNQFRANHPGPYGFNNFRQQTPQHQQFFGGRYNNFPNNRNYNNRWERPYNPTRDHVEPENCHETDKFLQWGSGAPGNGLRNTNNNPNKNNLFADFTQDNFEYCWDEQSFRQHEDFLANMDEGYQHDTVEFHPSGPHSHQDGSKPDQSDTGFKKKSRLDLPYIVRKRPRHEDYPIDPTAKSSKSLEQEKDSQNSETCDFQSEVINVTHSKHAQPIVNKTGNSLGYDSTTHQEKNSLDNASDSILERAERLCKELREKREASSAQRANLLKTQTHHSLNDKMNNLKKNKQSYLKGHITNMSNDQISTSENTSAISTISYASAFPQTSKEPLSQKKLSSSSSKSKTLDEIRKSIEQSVLDGSKGSSSSISQFDKIRDRVRASSLSDSSSSPLSSAQSKGRVDSGGDSEVRQTRPLHKLDSNSSVSKTGSKQPITKENLNKMVNCPRSRTERLHLARMFQSRTDKSSAHVSSRSNINLEGLYDSPDIADLEIDVGGNMPTLKLEDLSDDVRSQILGLIHDDIGTIHKSNVLLENDVEIIDEEKRKAKKTVLSHENKLVGELDPGDKKSKKKSLVTKTQRKNSVTSTNLAQSQPNSVDQDSSAKSNRVSTMKKGNVTKSNSNNDNKNTDSGDKIKSSSVIATATQLNEKNTPDEVNSTSPSILEKNSSPRLTSENILSRYPTILGTMGTNSTNVPSSVNNRNSHSIDDGDSGRSSMSIPSSTVPLPLGSSDLQPPSYKSLSSLELQTQALPTVSLSSQSTPIEEAVSLLKSRQPFRSDHPNEVDDTRSSIATSLGTDVSSNTMSELLALSEQEESVKQEMMSMELRLTRLHRLLEQAVYQINKCTERRNELQDEEKNLTRRRLTLLREATSSSHQDSRSDGTTPSVAIASTIQTNSNISTSERLSLQTQPSTIDLPAPEEHDSHRPETSLSRSEWLAKFSAYLPSGLVSSNTSNEKPSPCSQPSQTSGTDRCKAKQSTTSVLSTSASTQGRLSSDPNRLQMVPERDIEPALQKESYIRIDSCNHQNIRDQFISRSKDVTIGDSNPLPNADNSPSTTQEFTSPIMYVGTIKSGAGQTSKDTAVPVMMINSATISSLFSGARDLGENLNPVKVVGLGDQPDINNEKSIPPVVRRSSLGSPRQEDSDIGSIASVASGSSLGEQITRYCRFTPGASADGHNPHDLSIILSGPSDTSDLRGLEEDDNFGKSRMGPGEDNGANEKIAKLKEDAGNDRLYGRLDQESIKSAEVLHLMERNNEIPASSIDRKKKKRKTKQQRNSGIKGRPKPYIISSSSADENEASKKVDERCLSSLEQRLRKSPESTNDDSSDQHSSFSKRQSSQAKSLNPSPSKSEYGTDITIAECDSSTNPGMVDSQSLNESSSRLKEMNESFEKTFGRKPRDKSSFFRREESTEDNIIVLSDDIAVEKSHQNDLCSDVIDLCGDDNIQTSSGTTYEKPSDLENFCIYPGNVGPVDFICCLGEKIYVGFLKNGFKVFHLSRETLKQDKHHPISDLSCMAVAKVDDEDIVCAGSGHSVITVNMENKVWRKLDMGTAVQCLHIMEKHMFAGLDTGELCVHDIKSWKKINRYICSDCPIHCMASGSEGGTRVLCVASQDSIITVVDADRCLPLRILTGHSKTAFTVQVYGQYVFSGSGDSTVVIHNLHTARVEKVFRDNKSIVYSVFFSQGHLFCGGMDKLVRVYNVKSQNLVQVYYGAGMGTIRSIYVYKEKKLITGNSMGSIIVVDLDLNAKYPCKHKRCGLNFGLASHLAWHIEKDH